MYGEQYCLFKIENKADDLVTLGMCGASPERIGKTKGGYQQG